LSRQFHQLGQPVQAGTHGIGIVCHALPTVHDGNGFRACIKAYAQYIGTYRLLREEPSYLNN
jgi:hypothetical protein